MRPLDATGEDRSAPVVARRDAQRRAVARSSFESAAGVVARPLLERQATGSRAVAGAMVVAGIAMGAALFSYNRKNYFFDRKLRQERLFQEQDMQVEQYKLYREDVRDLVELTVGKMDVYLVVAALMIDRLTVMVCKQNRAFPVWSPDWAVTLNSLSLASGVCYLLLALWLAMYASVSAQAYGTFLLTQYVRIPYATPEQLDAATARGADFEEEDLRSIVRVPVLSGVRDSAPAAPVAGADAAGSVEGRVAQPQTVERGQSLLEAEGAGVAPPDSVGDRAMEQQDSDGAQQRDSRLPTAMLRHIRVYRSVQLNWQAYDAYARVSLFAGTSSLLYCCLYWSLGQLLQVVRSPLSAIGVAVIFSAVQVALTRLDLKLNSRDALKIACLLATTPLLTTVGMLLYRDMWHEEKEPTMLKKCAMGTCAVTAHTLHCLVAGVMECGNPQHLLVLVSVFPKNDLRASRHQARVPAVVHTLCVFSVEP